MFFFVFRTNEIRKMVYKILFIVLGCNIQSLMYDRLNTAILYALQQANGTRVDWLLSGGIKNARESTVSEAEKMSKVLLSQNVSSWAFILDEDSKNTAQNFVMANAWMKNFHYDEIKIVTSAFHQPRCEVMANHILEADKTSYGWLLGDMELPDSRYWERIHMQNALKDAEEALQDSLKNNIVLQEMY